MVVRSLTIDPYHKPAFTAALSLEKREAGGAVHCLKEKDGAYIFSDLSYRFRLDGEGLDEVQDVSVFINDEYEQSQARDGCIVFPENGYERRIFQDCYGYAEIALEITDGAGKVHRYVTPYLPVMVRKGALNDAVRAMVQYVYENQERLLLNGRPKARDLGTLKENGLRTLSAQLRLAEEIAALYERSYGYFRANSRFRMEKAATVDRIERLQTIAPATLQFTATHPAYLRRNSANGGLRIGKGSYQPEKTLSMQNMRTYDTYENRVVLGFIRQMLGGLSRMKTQCETLLEGLSQRESHSEEYLDSAYFMCAETRQTLEHGRESLTALGTKFAALWRRYQSALQIEPDAAEEAPKPTPIFMAVPQYHRLFLKMYEWFHFGVYDFSREQFMLPLIDISSLYECYLLAKMIRYFETREYTLEEAQKFEYPMEAQWRYRNTGCSNTFLFRKDGRRLLLYYQPVIYDPGHRDGNGIGLMRNNSLGGRGDNVGGHYYSPDYLIKVEEGETARYLILDAKFSDLKCVKQRYLRDLVFKYLFSVSPIEQTESVEGLCLIYGKCSEGEQLESAYDKRLPGQQIRPAALFLPLMEGVATEEHYTRLDRLMQTVLPQTERKKSDPSF